MKEILLTQGKFPLVDDADYALLAQYKWYYGEGYAIRCRGKKTLRMHRAILNAPSGVAIDHADGNKLNNCRHNLRIATASQNGANRDRVRNNTTGFKGVTYATNRQSPSKYRAQIRVLDRGLRLGWFKTAEEAARAYDFAAIAWFGVFANVNFPHEHKEV